MLGSSGLPIFPIDVVAGRGIDISCPGLSFRFDLDDGAILTGGSGALFTVSTELGDAKLKRGLGFHILANRDFTGVPRIAVDDAAAKPWLDVEGQRLARVIEGRLYRVTYDPTLDAFRSNSPVLVENDDLAPAPVGTVKGNTGDGNADLTIDEARALLAVDHVMNKSEAELLASGPLSDAIGLKASQNDLNGAISALTSAINGKTSPADVNGIVDPVKARLAVVELGQKSTRITRALYSDFASLTLDANASYESREKTGTHPGIVSEFGYANGQVPNGGLFIPQGSPLALRRIDDIGTVNFNAAPTVPSLADDATVLLLAADGTTLQRLTGASLKALIEEITVADRFPNYFEASGDYGTAPVTAVAEATDGAGIGVLSFKNESKTAFASVAFGKDAVLNKGGSDTYGPGAGYTYTKVPPGRISVVTDTDATPVTLRFWRSVKSDPNAGARAAAHLARYTGSMTAPQQTAIRNLYIALYDAGILKLAATGGGIWVGRAPNNPDGLLNWSGTGSFGTTVLSGADVPSTSFAGTQFNGSNAINSLVTPPASALSNHSMFQWSDTTASPSGTKVAMGNSVLRVAPNRSSSLATLYTGAGSSLVASSGLGGLQGYRRDNVNTFRFFRNDGAGADTTKTVSETTGGSGPILIGALNTTSSLQLGWTGILEFALMTFGAVPTDAQVVQLYNALNAYRTALGV